MQNAIIQAAEHSDKHTGSSKSLMTLTEYLKIILRKGAESLLAPWTHPANITLDQGILADNLAISIVKPVIKSRDNSSVDNNWAVAHAQASST